MKLYTIFPVGLGAKPWWSVAEVQRDRFERIKEYETFAEACKAERALRREAFSAVLKSKGKKK